MKTSLKEKKRVNSKLALPFTAISGSPAVKAIKLDDALLSIEQPPVGKLARVIYSCWDEN